MTDMHLQKKYLNGGAISASRKCFRGNAASHGHDFFEIEFILGGSGRYEIDGACYDLSPGMLFLLSPANVHSVTDADAEMINVMFRCDVLDDSLAFPTVTDSASPFFFIEGETRELLTRLLTEIVEVHRTEERYASLLLRTALYKLSLLCPAPREADTSSYVRRAVLFLMENFKRGITLAEVSFHLGLSESYLSDLFHRQTGVTFKEYLDNIRFSYAQSLLCFTDVPIKAIYEQAGFRDYANFARRFKERFGVTPSAYKQRGEKDRP